MLAAERDIEWFYADPATAIDVANEFRPTVILQDLIMPDIDGLHRGNSIVRMQGRATHRW